MIRPREDRLFERFRRKGDARALSELCERVAPELIRVGGFLIGDSDLAEDLTQETFLVAMRDADSWDSSRRLMPWLLGILANQARKMRRERERHPDPGRLHEPRSTEPIHSASWKELDVALHAALGQLDDVHGAALREHLLEGRTSSEMAAAAGERPGTVRMRLHRGMEQLRRLLPAGFAAGTLGTVVPSQSAVAALKQRLLAELPAAKVVAKGTALVLGGVVLNKMILAVAGLLVLGLIGWTFQSFSVFAPDEEGPQALGEQSAGESSGVGEAARVAAEDPGEKRTVVAQSSTAQSERGTLSLRVVNAETGEPVEGLRVTFTGTQRGSGRTDVSGRIQHVAEFGPVSVQFEDLEEDPNTDTRRFVIETDHDAEQTIKLEAQTRIEVSVVDANGEPVLGALIDRQVADGDLTPSGATDDKGIWRSSSVQPLVLLRAVKAGFRPSALVSVRRSTQLSRRRLVLGGPAVTVRGVVLGPDGSAAAFAKVGVQEPNAKPGMMAESPLVVTCDDQGRFECQSVAPSGALLLASADEEGRTYYGRETLEGDSDREGIVIRLQRGATITGRLPVAERMASFISSQPSESGLSSLFRRHLTCEGVLEPDGTYLIDGVPPGHVTVTARYRAQLRKIEFDMRNGQPRVWNPQFAELTQFKLRLLDSNGEALEGWTVKLRCKNEVIAPDVSDASGRCQFECEGMSVIEAVLFAPGSKLIAYSKSGLLAGSKELEIRVPGDKIPSARLRVRIMPAEGIEMADLICVVAREPFGSFDVKPAADGTLDLPAVLPGTYTVMVKRGAREFLAQTSRGAVGPGGTQDFGDLVVAAPWHLTFDLSAVSSELRKKLFVGMRMGDAIFDMTKGLEVGPSSIRTPNLTVRDYEYVVWGRSIELVRHSVHGVSGQNQRIVVQVRSVASLELTFAEPFRGKVTLRSQAGGFVTQESLHQASTYTRGLAAGNYEVTCKMASGQAMTYEVQVDSSGVQRVNVEFD